LKLRINHILCFAVHFSLFTVLASAPEERFAAMSPEEVRAYEQDTMKHVADLALIPPVINTNPLPKYDYDQLDYGMTIGIERSPGGRLWACWVAGEDGPKAFFVVNRSDDDGETWSKPCLVINAHAPDRILIPRSTLVGNFWTAPDGALHLFFSQSMYNYDGRAGTWETVCNNPDVETPVWSAPRRIWHGYVLNKPTELSNGEWLLPLEFPNFPNAGREFKTIHQGLEPLRGANVFVSSDKGQSWSRRACLRFPNPNWDEHMFVELKDGRIWMLARTGKGIMQSFSSDNGKTWSEPSAPANIKQPVARFYIRRLASGRILLIKHGRTIDTHEGRSLLTAWLSEDEGQSWIGGLMLDERKGVSYPDGFQAPDGTLYISYDHNRASDGEILMARFTEEDILAKKLIGPKSKLRMLISRPLKREARAEAVKRKANASEQALFTGPQAELETPGGEVRKLKKNASIYSNRTYTFYELPTPLTGKRYIFSELETTDAVCSKAGVVYVLCATPQRNPNDNPEAELTAQGFVKAAVPEFVITLVRGAARPQETCSVYQKILKPGETVRFGRWGVLAF
jgi:hypothetical protein